MKNVVLGICLFIALSMLFAICVVLYALMSGVGIEGHGVVLLLLFLFSLLLGTGVLNQLSRMFGSHGNTLRKDSALPYWLVLSGMQLAFFILVVIATQLGKPTPIYYGQHLDETAKAVFVKELGRKTSVYETENSGSLYLRIGDSYDLSMGTLMFLRDRYPSMTLENWSQKLTTKCLESETRRGLQPLCKEDDFIDISNVYFPLRGLARVISKVPGCSQTSFFLNIGSGWREVFQWERRCY